MVSATFALDIAKRSDDRFGLVGRLVKHLAWLDSLSVWIALRSGVLDLDWFKEPGRSVLSAVIALHEVVVTPDVEQELGLITGEDEEVAEICAELDVGVLPPAQW